MRRKRQSLRISPERAAHALHLLIAEGKISATDVVDALRRREVLLADLKKKLAILEGGVMTKDGPFPMVGRKRPARPKAKRRMSPARRSALKLHGQYLGAVRRLPKAARSKVKAIREKSGVTAAVAAANRMAK